MDGVANEEDYDQYGDPMREDDADDDETYVKRRMKTPLPTKDRNPWRRKVTTMGSIIQQQTKEGRRSV